MFFFVFGAWHTWGYNVSQEWANNLFFRCFSLCHEKNVWRVGRHATERFSWALLWGSWWNTKRNTTPVAWLADNATPKLSQVSKDFTSMRFFPTEVLQFSFKHEKKTTSRAEPCFFLLCAGYTLAWRLRGRLRRATVCVNVGYARLRGIHLPTRNASARNRTRTFCIYLRNSWSWGRRTWRTGAWRRGLGSKALCLAYKQNQKRELLNLDYGPADGQGPVGWLCWLRECLRGGYAEAIRGDEN